MLTKKEQYLEALKKTKKVQGDKLWLIEIIINISDYDIESLIKVMETKFNFIR